MACTPPVDGRQILSLGVHQNLAPAGSVLQAKASFLAPSLVASSAQLPCQAKEMVAASAQQQLAQEDQWQQLHEIHVCQLPHLLQT